MHILLQERYDGMKRIFIYGFLICIIFCIPVAIFSTNDYIVSNIVTIFVGYFCSILIFIKTKTILSRNPQIEGLTGTLIFSNIITYIIYLFMITILYILFDKSVFLVILGVLAYKISLIINVIKGGVSIE